MTANNPALVAIQEARLLWPDHRIDTLVSLGVGVAPPARREKVCKCACTHVRSGLRVRLSPASTHRCCCCHQGLSGFLETGSILIESSTTVQRAHEALSTLLPLVPGCRYFR